jgi:hypothetical protein
LIESFDGQFLEQVMLFGREELLRADIDVSENAEATCIAGQALWRGDCEYWEEGVPVQTERGHRQTALIWRDTEGVQIASVINEYLDGTWTDTTIIENDPAGRPVFVYALGALAGGGVTTVELTHVFSEGVLSTRTTADQDGDGMTDSRMEVETRPGYRHSTNYLDSDGDGFFERRSVLIAEAGIITSHYIEEDRDRDGVFEVRGPELSGDAVRDPHGLR